MSDTKLPAVDARPNPCLCCPPIRDTLPMSAVVAVGFGDASLTRDGEVLYSEGHAGFADETAHIRKHDDLTVEQAEIIALSNEDADWRIHLHGPMHGEVYQRQGRELWVLVEQDRGFA